MLGILHPPLNPIANDQLVDVHELHADIAAIGLFKTVQNPSQRLAIRASHIAGREGPIQIGHCEPVKGRVQFGRPCRRAPSGSTLEIK